jgi:dienelactone hydrolase
MKRIAAVAARAGLALALLAGVARCEKPTPDVQPLATLANAVGGGRVYYTSLTVPPSATSFIGAIHERATVWGDLDLPAQGAGRVPAVILAHSCAGVGAALRGWAGVLRGAGYAVFTLDSFGARGIREVCTGSQAINMASILADIYRAQALLASHPAIDPARIAVMGFSFGGRAAVWAALERYQRQLKAPGTAPLAAYLAFYPASCWFRFRDETEVAGGPIRLFHGTADDATPIAACRDWTARMRAAGRDVGIYEYSGAHHSFDNGAISPPRLFPEHVNQGKCEFVEWPDGGFIDRGTGSRPGPAAACATRGYTQGYDVVAYQKSVADVKSFLAAIFRTGGN